MVDEKLNGGVNMTVGEKTINRGPYRIGDVTNNAIVLLRNYMNPEIALINLGVADSVNARDIVAELVGDYIAEHIPAENKIPDNLEAFIIGGDYREHRRADDGTVVYVDHKLAYQKAVEALEDLDLKVTTVEVDRLAVKLVLVDAQGSFEVNGCREGLNVEEAKMSKAEYDLIIGGGLVD